MSKMTMWEQLAYPFPERFVYWFNKGGNDLAYLDARTVMDRLDQVVGPENWSDSYTETESGRVICTIVVAFFEEGKKFVVSKSDGAGDTSIEGEKGGLSDAFKRAAVKFGIGRYLYRLAGPSNVTGRLPEWAMPGGGPVPDATTDFGGDQDVESNGEVPQLEATGGSVGGAGDTSHGKDDGVVVDIEEHKQKKMREQFEALQADGIGKLGLEEYLKVASFIFEEAYGGLTWKDEAVDLDMARSMYKDLRRAIDNELEKQGA